ncbi:hypothetical protein ACIRD6_20400 [Streptomyces sp. NPDC102473]|uniref:hypothetical protein n=1 Tax=Streptomyces sp. NPDC102473 TaxID=3366180 RepID=UPI0037FC412C
MLEIYGPGCFNDFLWIYENSRPDIWPNVKARSRESSEILAGKEILQISSVLGRFGVTPDDLIQWGSTDNADSLFWIPVGQVDHWPTLIVEAGQLDFVVIEEQSPDIVLSLLEGALDCPFFPAEYGDCGPSFEAWSGGELPERARSSGGVD